MRIINNLTAVSNNYNLTKSAKPQAENKRQAVSSDYASIPIHYRGSGIISFAGMPKIKPGRINLETEKNKLLKLLEEILEADTPEADLSEMVVSALQRSLKRVRSTLNRKKHVLEELQALSDNKTLPPQKKLELSLSLQKEWKLIENQSKKKPIIKPQVDKKDERIDYQLINRFKTAVSEDNFDLNKVFKDFYSDLHEIKTIGELNERYPKIKIPRRPEEVFAKKIESVLTRDFYEELDVLFEQNDIEKMFDLSERKVKELLDAHFKGSNIKTEGIYATVANATHKAIAQRLKAIRQKSGFSSVPDVRKIKTPQITGEDVKLLCIDFDEFVISTIKKHYLEGKKLNEITHSQYGLTVSGATNTPEYKFEKLNEKVKSIMNSSRQLHEAQRDYANFDAAALKARLNFHANSEIGNDEKLLETIISFDSCKFGKDDIEPLIKLLRELDNIKDGKKTCGEVLSLIKKEGIRPKETERLNELERKKTAQIFKVEQQKAFRLNILKNCFDDAMNLLYMNNSNSLATTCSKYRPESLNAKDVEEAEYIIKLITKSLKEGENKFANKSKLEASIMRWDTLNYYKKNHSTNPVYIKALAVGKEADGKINTDKAGQYIMNSEIIESYPECKDFVKNPEVLEKIIEKTAGDKEEAIYYLSKFDDYLNLEEKEKTRISKMLEFFDPKDSIDKSILKNIIENEYINTDTSVIVGENSSITAVFSTKAKKAIMDKYKFPLSIDFLKGFEEALATFASERGTSGIKKIARNNETQLYRIEVKLNGHDDRLFSSENDYLFDIFSEKGIH